eukprot:1099521_1
MNWCETTGECVRGATCPECKHDFADTIYCKDASGKEECCEGNECPGSPEQPLCESVNIYDYFVADYGKCAQGSGTKYCESTGECSSDTGKTCAKCPSNKPYYRQIPGGGECCDQKDVSNTYKCIIIWFK